MKEKDTRTKILDLAESLLQDKGFNGFSYNDISSVLAIKNAAVHYYYPTKEDLGTDIIRRARERFHKWTSRPETAAMNVIERFEGFLKVYTYHIEKGHSACLLGALGHTFMNLPDRMQQEGRLLLDELTEWFGNLLEEGRGKGILSFRGEGSTQALFLMSALAGALQVSRITDARHFYNVLNQVRNELIIPGKHGQPEPKGVSNA